MITRKPYRIRSFVNRYCSITRDLSKTNLNVATHDRSTANALRRNQRRLEEFESNIELAKQFKTHRQNVVEILKDEKNIDALFEKEVPILVNDYGKLTEEMGVLSFNDIEMRNTIMLVCHSLVESMYIELTLNKLEDKRIKPYLEEIKSSYWFESLAEYRFRFYNFKSSQFLSSTESDMSTQINGNNFVRFNSCQKDSRECIEKFERSFEKYKKAQNESIAHIQLGINIVQDLLCAHEYIPTTEIWHYLLDNLGKLQLYNYQQIIYLSLFQYKHQPTILATPKEKDRLTAPLMADHFSHLIEDFPEILSTLCKYQEVRKDKRTFIELLSFLKLDKLAGEVMALKSPLLSKTKYKLPAICPGIEFESKDLFISRNCLYLIMQSAINLGLYEYVDLLYDKIVLDSIDPHRIQLNYEEKRLVEGSIFTPELFLIMLEACKKSKDLGRVLWLMPFLDDYVGKNSVPVTLKISILEVLKIFNLEGKLVSYQKIM
ncbi:conserved hypothetical protein [Candida dubliniensis CD36]|uniref:Uncharacterized protein n=1 Tax=Candida dubliniensis (strain CD36 / ATCC MYA-646 / CBS 7987 / NCPF 3949 / NRRL Y-17841) TaxID=573826 RepID=B9WCP5_CANDC|nr:conserved hypothetical protein [Candida dubliniensis CD36]CAX44168.1 conserved hypothetical protein [Candida dubliniensis CD36]